MVAFTLNGRPATASAAPDTPLLWVLREHLKLTGTKYGCGAGLCGACTVHVDGKAAFSCQTNVSEVAGKSVTTIEGLSPGSDHPPPATSKTRLLGREACAPNGAPNGARLPSLDRRPTSVERRSTSFDVALDRKVNLPNSCRYMVTECESARSKAHELGLGDGAGGGTRTPKPVKGGGF